MEDIALAPGEVRIGTSGWSYDDWRGVLYPPGTPSARRLEAYAAVFDTVELNASFYHWPRAEMFHAWRDRLPPGFLMTVKAPRGLTHARRLAAPEQWTARLAEGLSALGDRGGLLLLQLPPDLVRDDDRLDRTLQAMPAGVRVAVELRHPSWVHEDVFAVLEEHRASYCVMSGAQLPCVLRATAETVYVRFHGPDPDRLYVGSYGDDALAGWAQRMAEWRADGHSVVCYFNNDGAGNAVRDARRLRAQVSWIGRGG
ncbi:DUF72 domain-containing protein [Raineyella sp. LH-20]|uniref:DUF72 domain-containing protein n=1 Tax=Raineyella sp. LH-20 TaxID=3081204 RepID=UPI002953C3CF|nr:DUF72 domain-containing protein [Raineyella sp. LH-20]WOP18647.1 DUF72 domain-containing protein [Raineyella sp. LH-20]